MSSGNVIFDNETKLYKELGKAGKPDLFIEDHGILTLYVNVDFGGHGQGFGGYSLDTYNKKLNRRVGHAAGTDFILQLLELFDVQRLEEIKGRSVYALRESDAWSSTIVGLETPKFDGGRRFLVSDWQKQWYPADH